MRILPLNSIQENVLGNLMCIDTKVVNSTNDVAIPTITKIDNTISVPELPEITADNVWSICSYKGDIRVAVDRKVTNQYGKGGSFTYVNNDDCDKSISVWSSSYSYDSTSYVRMYDENGTLVYEYGSRGNFPIVTLKPRHKLYVKSSNVTYAITNITWKNWEYIGRYSDYKNCVYIGSNSNIDEGTVYFSIPIDFTKHNYLDLTLTMGTVDYYDANNHHAYFGLVEDPSSDEYSMHGKREISNISEYSIDIPDSLTPNKPYYITFNISNMGILIKSLESSKEREKYMSKDNMIYFLGELVKRINND